MKVKSLENMLSLQGSRAVITGAADGIGAAIAKRYAEAGSDLILLDIDEKALHRLAKKLEKYEVHTETYIVDISSKDEIDEFWKGLGKKKVDILINNAGSFIFKDYLKLDLAFLEQSMNVNLYSVIWMSQNFIKRRMPKGGRKRGGVIVNIGSIEAILPFKKDLTQYSLAKVGVLIVTRDLASEFARKGFRINAVIPGGIMTEGTKNAALKAMATIDFGLMKDSYNFNERIPAGRLGQPDDVAKVVLALATDIASYMHGALIPVDGGFLSN